MLVMFFDPLLMFFKDESKEFELFYVTSRD